MKYNRHPAKVLFLLIATSFLLPLLFKIASAAPLFIDASVDLTKLKIADKNAVGNATTDSSIPVQAAIDYLAKNPEGGSLIFAPGVYRVGGIVVKPGVKIIGADRQRTIFRSASSGVMFDMQGGELHNFTAYGTPDAASSGDNWKVGTGGVGKGGSAQSLMVIRVGSSPTLIAKDVIISNVTAEESRYDCLYIRNSQNLQVLNCNFDRAGRVVIHIAGNDENFQFSGCHFGSLWGLYQFDLQPNNGKFVRDGMFLNCVFDGTHAGDMNTDTWGALFMISGEGDQLDNGNISVVGCTFRKIDVRIRAMFSMMQFLYNPQLGKLIKLRTNPTGELRDATIRGNYFGTPQKPMKNIVSGVTFTGKSTFEGNTPAATNDTKITSQSPVALESAASHATNSVLKINPQDGKVVTIALAGHQFNFETDTVLDNRINGEADVVFYSDPLKAVGKAGLKVLSAADLKAGDKLLSKLSSAEYGTSLWGVAKGDTIAVKTNSGRYVVMKILDQQKEDYTIQYRLVE